MKYKEFKVRYKDEGNGSLEGYASTWIQEPDSYGDIVRKGAFAGTLKDRWNGGKGIPLLWDHQMGNLSAIIGTAAADEDEKGLHFVADFDETDEAQRVRALYKDGRLSKFSFAYDTLDEGPVELDGGVKANELRELDLYEISCVMIPANEDAGIVDVKAGRRNSGKDEALIRQAISALEALLDNAIDDDGEDGSKGNPNGEDPEGRNSDNEELLKKIDTYLKEA